MSGTGSGLPVPATIHINGLSVAVGTTVAATTATTTTTTGAILARFGLIDCQSAAVDIAPIQPFDGLLPATVIGHLDKTEAFGLTGVSVHDQLGTVNVAEVGKQGPQFVFSRVIRQVSNIDIHKITSLFGIEKRAARYQCLRHSHQREWKWGGIEKLGYVRSVDRFHRHAPVTIR